MNINDISLPASVVAGLYKNSLVIPGELPANKQPEQVKTVLILYYKSDKQSRFVDDLLIACHIDKIKAELKELKKDEAYDYKELLDKSHFKEIILFGVEPSAIQLPLSFPHFQLQSFAGRSILFTPPLSEMKDDKLLKSRLWVSLRRMFNI